jgi:hypothetical protein
MKSTRIVLACIAAALLVLGGSWIAASARGTAAPQQAPSESQDVGTAFTFQGHLTFNDLPVDDSCLMQFKLYDEAAGGNQVGPAFTPSAAVPVQTGLFSVELDFGDVFGNIALWLETAVRCSGDSDYTSLGRQRLTIAPQAGTARRLDGNTSAFYRNAANLNAGTLATDRFSAFTDLSVEGYLANTAGDLAQNNGTLQASLNADMLDDVHGSYYERSYIEGTVMSGGTAIIEIPNWYPFTIQMASGWPDVGGVAFVTGMENDDFVAITYVAYNGDGTSITGGAECGEASNSVLLQFGSGNYVYQLRCPGESSDPHNLVLVATNSWVELRYKLVY